MRKERLRDCTSAYTDATAFYYTPRFSHFFSVFSLHFNSSFSVQLINIRAVPVPIMDQRIFDQLDRLERGARVETRPARESYNDSDTGYPAYESYSPGYADDSRAYYGGDGGQEEDPYAVQPMTLDSFGEETSQHLLSQC